MEAILELLWSFAPRLLICVLFTVAAILLMVWLLPDDAARSHALCCVAVAGIVAGISWEIYARLKKSRTRPD
jgi:hypothetical protein